MKSVLAADRVEARARGTFYVRKGGGTKRDDFDSSAQVGLGREK